jgi:molybdopterin molybdotransferase
VSLPVKSFFRVVTVEEAKEQIAAFAPPVATETVAAADACGRVLARDVFSPGDLPHFHRANMDGYAVRARDTFGASASLPAYLRLAGVVEMGAAARRALRGGEAVRVSTGGMLPPGADAVVMVEYTEESADGVVEIHRSVSPWENVIRIGEDIKKGGLVFRRGRRLRPRDLGALTGVGLTRVPVFRRPTVALISTGDEIVEPTKKPRPGQVRNVNQYSLRAMIAECGGEVVDLGVVRDERSAFERALREGLGRADVVVLSGGSSVGVKDMAVEVIGSFSGSRVFFHGISIAPGKPTIYAAARGKPVMGLPGHPVSALVIFELFGGPLVRMVGGEAAESAFAFRRTARALLTGNVASAPGREDYVRVRLERRDGRLHASPLAGKSGAIFSLVGADGMVRIALGEEGLEAGEEVEVILL